MGLLVGGATSARADGTPVTTTTHITCASPVVYTGQPLTPCSATVSAADGSKTWAVPVDYPNNHTDAGTVNVSAGMGDVPGYTGSNNFGQFTIAKAPTSASLTCPKTVDYTGSEVEPCTATLTYNGETSSVDVLYENNTGPGKALARVMFPGDTNHLGSGASTSFLIGRPTTVTISCTAGSVYTGSPLTPCTATATSGTFSTSVPVTYDKNTNAGTATASAAYPGDGTGGHLPGSSTTTFTIAPAPSTTTVTCPASVVYTGSALTPCTVTIDAVGTAQGPSSSFFGYQNNTSVTGTGPKATFTVSYGGDGNRLPSSGSGSFEITKAPVVVTVTCPASASFRGTALTPCTATATGAGGLNADVPVTYTGNVYAGTATATATYPGDPSHLAGTGSATFQVKGYTLTGYRLPLTMSSGGSIAWNSARAGSTIPLRFSASLPDGSVVPSTTVLGATLSVTPVSCTTGAATGPATGPVGGVFSASQQYFGADGEFAFNWKTPKTPGCYQVTTTTADHSTLSASVVLR